MNQPRPRLAEPRRTPKKNVPCILDLAGRAIDFKIHIPYTLGYMVKHTLHTHGEENLKAKKVINMAVGSISTLPQMVEAKNYCPEIIQQIDSVIGLLKSARTALLRGHLDSCITERLQSDKEGAVKELLKIYNMK